MNGEYNNIAKLSTHALDLIYAFLLL